VIAANEISPAIKRDLAQQVWCMIPARNKDHRAPFPERLPARFDPAVRNWRTRTRRSMKTRFNWGS
jgi:hypothetical protein